MKTITFGVKNINGSHYKLVINHSTKEFERGQLCLNSTFIDIWLKSQKEIKLIVDNLLANGYTETDKEFKEEN